jgi:hypothetical protein
MSKEKLDLSKLGTPQLRKQIESGRYTGETLEQMKTLLKKRDSKKGATAPKKDAKAAKKETPKKAAPAKKAAKKETAKKPAGEKKAKTPRVEDPNSIRAFLRKIITPKKGTIAAVTFSEAKALVAVQFKDRKRAQALYTSEFDDAVKKLIAAKVITERKSTSYKKAEGPKPAEKKVMKEETSTPAAPAAEEVVAQ